MPSPPRIRQFTRLSFFRGPVISTSAKSCFPLYFSRSNVKYLLVWQSENAIVTLRCEWNMMPSSKRFD